MCLTEVKCVKFQVYMEREVGFGGARMGRFRPAGKEPLKVRKKWASCCWWAKVHVQRQAGRGNLLGE